MAIIMDGKALAAKMQDQLQEKVARLKENEWIVPGLVVIMVGDNPASQVLNNITRIRYSMVFWFSCHCQIILMKCVFFWLLILKKMSMVSIL